MSKKGNMFDFDEDDDGFGDVDSGDFIKVGSLDDLAKGPINKKIIGKWVQVFGIGQEDAYAMEYGCKHHGANLKEGKVVNDVVTCPRHYWKYNVKTGESYTPNSPSLRKHAIRFNDGDIYVSIRPKNR